MTVDKSRREAAGPQPLSGIVVLDLSGALGNYCGKLFADLGADVILVEPLDGTPARRMEPRVEGRSDAEASLQFQYNNTNKRSIAVDLDRPEGQEVLRSLAVGADLLIETERPGVMEARGLGYKALKELAPQLVMTSITPFGQTGPYAQWQAEDIIGLALGGMLYLGGYTDSPPMAAYGYQAYAAGNLFGAVASMAAVYDAEVSGAGQHVDVSMQESVVMGMETAIQFCDLEGTVRKRTAGQQRMAGAGVFECKDGYIFLLAGGSGANRFWTPTVQWLVDEGVEGVEALQERKWSDQDYLATAEAKAIFKGVFSPFAKSHNKLELYTKGQQRRIPIAPVSSTADIVQSKQLQERGFFVTTQAAGDESGARPLVMPGAPYKLSATPWSLRRPAPRLGEHTSEILSALGINEERQVKLREQGVVR
jgi:benzylsuccinate CoA-transferase BbsE subunit